MWNHLMAANMWLTCDPSGGTLQTRYVAVVLVLGIECGSMPAQKSPRELTGHRRQQLHHSCCQATS